MAGLFALMYGLFATGSLFVDKVNKDFDTEISREVANNRNDIYYWNGNNEKVFTEGDIPCRDATLAGHNVLIGTKGKYKNQILYDYTQQEEDKRQSEFNEQITYAIAHNKDYIHSVHYRVKTLGYSYISGYEVKTKRKYIVYNMYDWKYFLIYLEDKPHTVFCDDRYIEVYDLIEESKIEISQEEYINRIGINR